MNETDWKELIGKRCLIATDRWGEKVIEVVVLEVSPNGNYIKVRFVKTGDIRWLKKWATELHCELAKELKGD